MRVPIYIIKGRKRMKKPIKSQMNRKLLHTTIMVCAKMYVANYNLF